MSRRLIEEHAFDFIAVEGDWPDCYRINRFARGMNDAGDSPYDVLHGFERWPTWMWANREVEALLEWMRDRNQTRPTERRAGFYGLDVYSLWDSMRAGLEYLDGVDPDAAGRARDAYGCFDPYGEDVQEYTSALRRDACDSIGALPQHHTRDPDRSRRWWQRRHETHSASRGNAVGETGWMRTALPHTRSSGSSDCGAMAACRSEAVLPAQRESRLSIRHDQRAAPSASDPALAY